MPEFKYNGVIYNIVRKLENTYIKNSSMVDYFYITFESKVYDSLLVRGWSVIYNGEEIILGDIERDRAGKITKMYKQNVNVCYEDETEIDVKNIYAILIWRVAFCIENQPNSGFSDSLV
jgi:hypothetical protein